ncbi:MAG: hypothetical protein R3E96_05850 [Planctomycetota bacterium]
MQFALPSAVLSPQQRRSKLRNARIMLIFTPELCADPLEALAHAWNEVDVIQVRPKPSAAAPMRSAAQGSASTGAARSCPWPNAVPNTDR